MTRALLPLACVLSLAATAGAGEPSVEARLSANEIFQGDSVTYEVYVKDLTTGAAPDLGETSKDFEIVPHGSQVQSNNFTMIINGQNVTPEQSTTTVFRYGLTPKRAGALKIAAPTVTVDGRKYSGRALSLNVIAAEEQDIALLEIETSKAKVYPTQPFDATLRIKLKPLPGNEGQDPLNLMSPVALEINWADVPEGLKAEGDISQWLSGHINGSNRGFTLNGLRVNNPNPFAMFEGNSYAVLNLDSHRENRKAADGSTLGYFVYELKRRFTPLRTGTYTFGQAKMRGTFAGGLSADHQHYVPRQLLVVTAARTVECVMPEPRPADFNGCIGKFRLDASASARDLRVGDPLVLKLEFERADGNGLLDDVTAPDLAANAKLAADFTIVDKAPTGQVKERKKSFSYTLRAKKAGVSIPPITVPVFDLSTEKFTPLSSEPISLNVIEAPQLRPDELVASNAQIHGQHISGREKGVFQNITDVSEVSQPALRPQLYVAAIALAWLAFAAFATALTVGRKRAGDFALQKRMRARSESTAHLSAAREALKKGDSAAAALEAQHAINAVIGHNGDISPAGLTPADARVILERCKVSAELRASTLHWLESMEASKYGSIAGVEAAAAVGTAERLVPDLQKEMESKR